MKLRALLFSLLALGLLTTPAQAQRALPTPKLIAVYFYADWCPNCKLLSPQYDRAVETHSLEGKDVLMVKMDLTNKSSIHQSLLLATQLGIGDFVRAQGSGTGYIAVLDATTKKELLRFDRTSRDDFIGDRLDKLLAG